MLADVMWVVVVVVAGCGVGGMLMGLGGLHAGASIAGDRCREKEEDDAECTQGDNHDRADW